MVVMVVVVNCFGNYQHNFCSRGTLDCLLAIGVSVGDGGGGSRLEEEVSGA